MGKVEINNSKTRAIVRVLTRDQLDEAAESVLRLAQEECPVQTGKLLASHRIEKPSEDKRIISANTFYARDVFDGAQGRRPNRWLTRAADRARL
jgi:hypothetical protein